MLTTWQVMQVGQTQTRLNTNRDRIQQQHHTTQAQCVGADQPLDNVTIEDTLGGDFPLSAHLSSCTYKLGTTLQTHTQICNLRHN